VSSSCRRFLSGYVAETVMKAPQIYVQVKRHGEIRWLWWRLDPPNPGMKVIASMAARTGPIEMWAFGLAGWQVMEFWSISVKPVFTKNAQWFRELYSRPRFDCTFRITVLLGEVGHLLNSSQWHKRKVTDLSRIGCESSFQTKTFSNSHP
jgi:hypothetical protein